MMTLNCVIASFNMEKGDSLKTLVDKGFDAPVKTNAGMMTRKSGFEFSNAIEVERIADQAFVTIHINHWAVAQDAVTEACQTLQSAGLL